VLTIVYFLKQLLHLNLSATGISAIICVWLISIVLLAIFGTDELADRAMGILAIAAA
jgi:hypothetical protein